jgi:predicted DCC family thiol-disulfide oxidoreductase YuxK
VNYPVDKIERPILLLDGECGLCNKFASFMHSKLQDKQAVQFLGIESEVGQSIIATFQNDLQQMDTVYFVYGMSVKTKSSAVIHCLKMMRFPYRFMALLVWLCPKGIRNVAYDFVAKRRKSFFGTSDSCVWDSFSSNLGAER